jgi:outer membrane protein OmpA-like peptidoglycan-associated protein
MTNFRKFFAASAALAILSLGAVAPAASAEQLTDQQIIERLKGPRLTRSLSGVSAATAPAAANTLSASDMAFINRVRGQKSRSLSAADRDQMASIAKQRPTVDLEIYFDYNSAALSPKAEPQLHNLGKALASDDLKGSVVMLGGHTDAKGNDGYNQSLSERRAETVKRFLIENYRLPADSLVSAGYGEKDLKNGADPFAAENRRVQIVNMAKQEQASR